MGVESPLPAAPPQGPGPQGWARAGEARGVDPSTPRGWLWGWCRSPAGTAQGREAHDDGGPRAGPRHPALTPSLPSPQLTMNDFSVHRIIGRGGFGEVYGCRKADTGKM